MLKKFDDNDFDRLALQGKLIFASYQLEGFIYCCDYGKKDKVFYSPMTDMYCLVPKD